MKIKLNIQKNGENLIKDNLLKESESKPKKAYFFMGDIKESGFDILEECLIDLKARKLIVIGIDKKNTTKKMLDTLYNYTKSVYLFDNNKMVELDTNICVFEYEEKAVIYILNATVSEGALTENIATYTTIEYDLTKKEDLESYKEYTENLIGISKLDEAIKLDKDVIKSLFENAQIFSPKQYNHNVMTIAELLGEKKEETKEAINETNADTYENVPKIPKVDLNNMADFSIDIDIDIEESVEREKTRVQELNAQDEPKVVERVNKGKEKHKKEISQEEKANSLEIEDIESAEFDENEVLDIESLLFEKADIKLDKKRVKEKIEKNKTDEDKAKTKKVDLSKVSNLIMELPKKPTKGRDVASIKVPNYIKEMIPEFFSATSNFKSIDRVDGVYKETNIKLEIIDIVSNKKYSDASAKLSQKVGQTYMTFSSEHFKDIEYNEEDIARIIKLSDDTYHIEIVAKDVQEYRIWKKLCTKNFKGSSRSYGVM